MCEYCEHGKPMMKIETMDKSKWGWGYDDEVKLTLTEAEDDPNTLSVFIDRGHIRIIDKNDCNCLDAGEKIKIKYCPMCGGQVTQI